VIYLDTSVLLQLYLRQPRAEEAREVLATNEPKVASWLLAVEAVVVLRRTLGDAAGTLLTRLDLDLKAFSLVDRLSEVAERVRQDPRLARCRSLDALHVATALELQAMAGHAVRLATFDTRLAEVAREVGLVVVG